MTKAAEDIPLVVICGPTASGKTAAALELARHLPVEVISADSRQVFRGMDIGTAKASAGEQNQVPHHLIDVVELDQEFTAADFAKHGREIARDIHRRGALPLVVGGTGLYIRALTEGLLDAPGADPELRARLHAEEARDGRGTLYARLQQLDPEAAARIHPNNTVRIVRALEVHLLTGRPISELQRGHAFGDRPFRTLKIGLHLAREVLIERIDHRVLQMVESGLFAEVAKLLEKGYTSELKAMRTLGYAESVQYLQGFVSREEAVALIQRNTRRYAKRQLTWFRSEPETIWVDCLKESAKILTLIDQFNPNSVPQRSGHAEDPV